MNVKERRVLLCGYLVKKNKSQLEIQLLRVFKDMTFLRSFGLRYRTLVAGDKHSSEICRVITPARFIDGTNKTTT